MTFISVAIITQQWRTSRWWCWWSMAFCQTRHHDSGFCGAIWVLAELQKWQFLFSISLLSDQSMTCSLLTSHFQTGTSAHQVLKSNSYYHVIENRKSRAEKVRVEKRHIFCENGHLVGTTPDLRSTLKRWLQDAGWLEIWNTTVKGKHWNRKTSTGSLWKIVKKKKVCFSPDSLKKILPTCDTDVSSWVTHRKPESGRLVENKTSST